MELRAKLKLDRQCPEKSLLWVLKYEPAKDAVGGNVLKKYALSAETGTWVPVPEGEPVPSECILPLQYWDPQERLI